METRLKAEKLTVVDHLSMAWLLFVLFVITPYVAWSILRALVG